MDPQRGFELAEVHLEQQLEDGVISQDEFNAEMRELARDYRAAAEEAEDQAYRDERDRW